ncbi:UDP-Gal:betaGlcNAc beta 1,3-galactosyltransferase 2-like, partial [Silurus meridionalis]
HVAYPYKYRFIVDQPQKCQHKPFLVVIVPVAPNEVMERDSIRNTWGNEKLIRERYAMVLFLLGLPSGKNAELQQARIHQENVRHQDMLQSNFIDSSKNATIKMMVMLEWLRDRCPQAHFAVKVDKDILLNIRHLMSMLFSLDIPHRNYLTGQLQNSNSETITLYPLGKCYIMSMDMPAKILMASKEIKPIRKDDVYIGMCLELLNIAPVNPPKPEQFVFIPPKLYNRCNISQLIAVVTYTPVQMVSFWNDVHKPGSPC